MIQIANSFCKVTQNKIVKGAFFSFLAAGSLAVLQYMGTVHIDNPGTASIVTFLVPFLTNLLNEWKSGVTQQ